MAKKIDEMIAEAYASGYSSDEIIGALVQNGYVEAPKMQEALQGHTPDQVLDYFANLSRKVTNPTLADQAKRQAGLFTRAVAPIATAAGTGFAAGGPYGAAVMGTGALLGPMVLDPLANISNQYLGTNITPPGQAMERLMTRAGLPQPQNAQERIVYDINRSMAGGAASPSMFSSLAGRMSPGTTQEVFKSMAQYPLQQTTAAGTSALAAGGLRESDAPLSAQLGGALLAGMVAPGGPKMSLAQNVPVARNVAQGAKAVVQPFTEEGRQVIVGGLLNRLASDPQRAQQMLESGAQPLIPGVKPTTAAIARDPGLAGAETPVRSTTDPSNLFGLRLSENQQALFKTFERMAGKPGSIARAEQKREDVTRPLREAAFENKQPVNPTPVGLAIERIMSNPETQRVPVDQAMQFVANLIKSRVKEDGSIDPQALYSIRKDITDAMAGKFSGEQSNMRLAKGQLAELLPVIDDVIESGAPGFKNYMDKFAKISSGIDQMRVLQGIQSKVTTGQPNLMTQAPVLSASALRRNLAQKAEEIDAKLSPVAQRRLDNIMLEIDRGMAATAPGIKPPGAETFKNMSMANFFGKVFSESIADNTTLRTMARPLDFLYKLPDEALQNLVTEAMLDPQLAATLMGKANMMKVEPLAKSLRKKAEQLGYGSYIGAQEGIK